MPESVDVTRVTQENVAKLDSVADDVFDAAIEPSRLRAYVAEPSHILLIATSSDVVIGQVKGVVHRHPDRATELYVDDLGVDPAYQRRHIATRLLSELRAIGRAAGCEEIWVATEPDNEPARKLYESLGLQPRTAMVFEAKL